MFWTELTTIALLHLLAVISPGPDFIMIVRNSLTYSRRVGIFTALGLSLGIIVHVTYCLIGVGLIISQSIVLFNVIKIAGAVYLIYIGYKSIKATRSETQIEITDAENQISAWQAVRTGFLTNALNPKVTLFFLSIFTLVISHETPLWAQMVYGTEMALATFVWFSVVATILSHQAIRKRFASVQHYFTKVMGGLLIALGIKVALTTHK